MRTESIFGILSLIVISASAGRENMMLLESGTWITEENFTTMIAKSFLYARCLNIYLSEPIYDAETLFHRFISSYPNEYLLGVRIYDCQGYFLLGPTDKEIAKAMEGVPSSISTTEILIIINGELKNNSELFDVSLYGNSNANIVSKSGIWTLSENYLKPRFFVKVDSYEDLMYDFDMINLRGRELQVSTVYRPPVCYLNKTVKRIIDGEEEDIYLADNDAEKDGMEIKIFLLLAEKLNFTWTMRKPKGTYRYGRRVNATLWNGGMIQLLREKKIDLAFGNIWLTQNHNEFVNMSEPWYQLSLHFLVPRPQPITNFWALTRPFSVGVWLLLLIMLFANSTFLCIRARLDPKFPKRFRSFFITITELIGRLLGTWVPRNIINARFELHLWQSIGVVLVTAYSSSLAVRLANWEYEDRIDTIPQFLEANLTWGRKGAQPYSYDYFDMDDPYASQLPSRYVPVKDDDETHRLIERGKFAILGKTIDLIFFPEDDIKDEDLEDYRLMKQSLGRFYSSFAVQPWLLRPFTTIILWLKESGITHYHLTDVLRRRTNFNLFEVLEEYEGSDGNAKSLKLTPLGAGFMMLIVGLLISTVVFFYELKQAADSRSIREVFRDIQKRREEWKLSAYKKKCQREAEFVDLNSSNMNIDLLIIRSARRSVSALDIRNNAFSTNYGSHSN
ncbi:hypothetical protein DMN91_010215 [Ooceraea biroi]|uniref:Ionotropic glutamate receptor L-glutamate and glycine-binding domain-containing protein n=1 Tax=Ooceraea biroi TaxID=2015173 RepID=A0A026WJD8_OOCBI|nr:uncharacterized protein LOC105278584 [Ooceraea biroi]EZA56100.1 hypothetical protein X777_03581 [Ooceraea biroi]RLU17974.1 hypothetical protein DMN91_010215 [Ooceraea biroi]